MIAHRNRRSKVAEKIPHARGGYNHGPSPEVLTSVRFLEIFKIFSFAGGLSFDTFPAGGSSVIDVPFRLAGRITQLPHPKFSEFRENEDFLKISFSTPFFATIAATEN